MHNNLKKFRIAVGTAQNADSAWTALRDFSKATVGHKLFTVMTVDMTVGLARRSFSDHPMEYPVSGTKPIKRDAWFDIVHLERRSFVANTIADIAQVFPDFRLIASLGCGSVINLPVIVGNELVATINLLHEENFYTPERVAAAELNLALPAMLCCTLAKHFAAASDRG